MRKQIKLSTSIIAFGLMIPTHSWVGAWTANQGDNYLKGAVNYFETSSRFGPENGFENFRNTNFNVYWEHGVRDDLTFFATGSLTDLENRTAWKHQVPASGILTWG